jgi:hypothetical protein
MTGAPISNAASFRAEARFQRVCALCGRPNPFHAHHVVEKFILRRMGVPLYDTRCALRLCAPPLHCHLTFEARMLAVPLVALTDDNIAYTYEILDSPRAREVGAKPAYEYLTSRYAGSDPRVVAPA